MLSGKWGAMCLGGAPPAGAFPALTPGWGLQLLEPRIVSTRLKMDNKKRLAYAIIRFLHDQLRHGGLSSDAQESLEGEWASCPMERVPAHRSTPPLACGPAHWPAMSTSHRQGHRAPPPSPGPPHHTVHPLGRSGQASSRRRGQALTSWGLGPFCPTCHWSSREDRRALALSSRVWPGSGEAWLSVPGFLPPPGAPGWAQPPPSSLGSPSVVTPQRALMSPPLGGDSVLAHTCCSQGWRACPGPDRRAHASPGPRAAWCLCQHA